MKLNDPANASSFADNFHYMHGIRKQMTELNPESKTNPRELVKYSTLQFFRGT